MLAEKLRALNTDFGLSEAKIAAAVGLSQGSVNRIKHGRQRAGYEAGKRIDELFDRLSRESRRQ